MGILEPLWVCELLYHILGCVIVVCIVVLIWTLLCAAGLWCWLFGWIVWLPQGLWSRNFLEIWRREVQCLLKWAYGSVSCAYRQSWQYYFSVLYLWQGLQIPGKERLPGFLWSEP